MRASLAKQLAEHFDVREEASGESVAKPWCSTVRLPSSFPASI